MQSKIMTKKIIKELEFPDEKQQEINKLVDELRQITEKLERKTKNNLKKKKKKRKDDLDKVSKELIGLETASSDKRLTIFS